MIRVKVFLRFNRGPISISPQSFRLLISNSRIQLRSISKSVLNVGVVVNIDAFHLSDIIRSFKLDFLRS